MSVQNSCIKCQFAEKNIPSGTKVSFRRGGAFILVQIGFDKTVENRHGK